MKRTFLTALLSLTTLLAAKADLIWYEPFNYPNGDLTNVSANVWTTFSNGKRDMYVNNQKLEVSATGGTVSRADDDYRALAVTSGSIYTNANQPLYASFTVNCTNLPNGVGTYFASFYSTVKGYYGRIWAMTNGTSLPNTWRLGVSGNAGTVSKVFPMDLALNTDYQVVIFWDPVVNYSVTMWVDPIDENDASFRSTDALTPPSTPVNSFAFRQASSFGNFFCTVSNLSVATTFGEAATNVWTTNAVAPLIVAQPQSVSSFTYSAFNLTGVAAGQGLANMTYQWLKDSTTLVPGANSNVLPFSSAQPSDSGNYQLIATTPFGLSVTSVVATVVVTNSTIPPVITLQPASTTTVYAHSPVTLRVAAIGPPPITYQWYYAGAQVFDDGLKWSGAASDTLTILDPQTANGTAGTYRCDVSNPYGTTPSANAVVVVTNPPPVSIAYLRSLVETTSYTATNTTALWQATGIVTTYTNLTTGNTASYYLQDGTGGLNIFVTFGSTWRPTQGDVVTFTGSLSTYRGTLELIADLQNNLATGFTVWSNNPAGLPAPKVLSWSGLNTNNNKFLELNVEGSVVMLTNVYFGTNAGVTVSTTGGATLAVTNEAGKAGYVYFSQVDLDTAGQVTPAFANTVRGVLTQATNTVPGYLVTVTRWSDIVTDAPPTMTLTQTRSGSNTTLNWTAVPYQYSYSVLSATEVSGPYTALQSGLTFTTAAGTYTDTNAPVARKFYRVVSP